MSELTEVKVKQRTVWLCAGLRKSYRVTDGRTDFGEWDNVDDAREFLRLLMLGSSCDCSCSATAAT